MKINDNPKTYTATSPPTIIIHALKENKRPIGYAPWPDQPKPKRTRKTKDTA